MMYRIARCFAALAVFIAGTVHAGAYRITSMDLAGATNSLGWDINNAGVFVGSGDSGGVGVGYLVSAGATTILSGPAGAVNTLATGISDGSVVVGRYVDRDSSGSFRANGFIYDGGSYTTLNYASATYTELRGISPDGRYITGDAILPSGEARTFAFDRIAAHFIDILAGPGSGIAQGVTNAGLVVGDHRSASTGRTVGFTYDIGTATLTDFEVPNAQHIIFRGISEAGLIDGYLRDATGVVHGFVGSATMVDWFDVPDGTFTTLAGINDAGWLAGGYLDAAGVSHAFLAIPASVVSEPSATWLLLMGVWAVHHRRRRHRRAGLGRRGSDQPGDRS